MRQPIRPGAILDAATPEEIARIIAEAFERQSVQEYTREKGSIALDGTGAGVDRLVVPAQYDWLCERVTISTSAAATVQFFENAQNPSDLLEPITVPASGLYGDSFSNTLYVPANSQILIAVSGGPASGSLSYNLQIRLKHRKS